jgi:purine catabolism regulator
MSPNTLLLHGKEVDLKIDEESKVPYEKLLHERDNRAVISAIHKILTEEVIKGQGINSITQLIYKLTHLPVVIVSVHGQVITHSGVSSLDLEISLSELVQFVKDQHGLPSLLPLDIVHFQTFLLLTAPIFIQEQLTGFCTLIIEDQLDNHAEYFNMLIEKVALVCSLCLFIEKTKVDSFERMKGFFFDEILSGHYSTSEEIIAKASFIQIDLSEPFFIGVIEYSNNRTNIVKDLEFHKELLDYISEFCIKQKHQYLISQNGKGIILLVTEKKNDKSSFLNLLHHALINKNPSTDFYIGVSRTTTIIKDAAQAYHEAVTAIRMVTKNSKVMYFDRLGIIGVMINKNNEPEVRKIAQNELGPLMIQKNKELIETLYSFLLNGGNLEKAADDVSLSISGLRYRISKIEEMLHKDIRNPVISYQLLLAIQSLILTEDISFNSQK